MGVNNYFKKDDPPCPACGRDGVACHAEFQWGALGFYTYHLGDTISWDLTKNVLIHDPRPAHGNALVAAYGGCSKCPPPPWMFIEIRADKLVRAYRSIDIEKTRHLLQEILDEQLCFVWGDQMSLPMALVSLPVLQPAIVDDYLPALRDKDFRHRRVVLTALYEALSDCHLFFERGGDRIGREGVLKAIKNIAASNSDPLAPEAGTMLKRLKKKKS